MQDEAVEKRQRAGWTAIGAGVLILIGGCATDDSGATDPRGEAILRVSVSAQTSGMPVPQATIRLFADYQRSCAQQGPLTAELLTANDGSLRVQSEGALIPGGTCFSLSVLPPPESGLQPADRVPFVLEFRAGPPLDSVQVDVALTEEA